MCVTNTSCDLFDYIIVIIIINIIIEYIYFSVTVPAGDNYYALSLFDTAGKVSNNEEKKIRKGENKIKKD